MIPPALRMNARRYVQHAGAKQLASRGRGHGLMGAEQPSALLCLVQLTPKGGLSMCCSGDGATTGTQGICRRLGSDGEKGFCTHRWRWCTHRWRWCNYRDAGHMPQALMEKRAFAHTDGDGAHTDGDGATTGTQGMLQAVLSDGEKGSCTHRAAFEPFHQRLSTAHNRKDCKAFQHTQTRDYNEAAPTHTDPPACGQASQPSSCIQQGQSAPGRGHRPLPSPLPGQSRAPCHLRSRS